MKYRPEIDGLRALAVVPVILFHAGYTGFSGGFVGVDIFFVISGYLIASIILADLAAGKFTIANFYERRARRILPALFFIMALTFAFAWAWLMPADMKSFAKSILAVTLFSSNIMFYRESGYFDTDAELKPLLHTWSLSVEEQFYVFFPLLLAAIWKFKRTFIAVIFTALAIASLWVAQYWSKQDPSAGFFLLPSRAWELLVGALAALYLSRPMQQPVPRLLTEVACFLGFGCIVFAILVYNSQTPYPSYYTLAPVVGAALIILFCTESCWLGKLLANRLCVGIGLISYSAYLWHQPLFAFARLRSFIAPSPELMLLLTLVTFLLAYLSWRYIELPFRNRKNFSRKQIFTAGASISVVCIGIGLFGYKTDGGFARPGFNASVKALVERVGINRGLSDACDSFDFSSPACQTSSEPEILVWGDSFAMHLVEGIIASKSDIALKQATVSMCGPIIGVAPIALPIYAQEWARQCIEFNNKVFNYLKNTQSIKYVVLSSPFNQYLNSDSKSMLPDGQLLTSKDTIAALLAQTLDQIRALNKIPVIISPPPRSGYDLGQCLLKTHFYRALPQTCNFPHALAQQEQKAVLEFLQKIAAQYSVIWLSDFICTDGTCKALMDNTFIYRDSGHLSKEGSRFVGTKMDFYGLLRAAQ